MTQDNAEERRAQLRRAALEYHEFPTPGKISIAATKQLVKHIIIQQIAERIVRSCTWQIVVYFQENKKTCAT